MPFILHHTAVCSGTRQVVLSQRWAAEVTSQADSWYQHRRRHTSAHEHLSKCQQQGAKPRQKHTLELNISSRSAASGSERQTWYVLLSPAMVGATWQWPKCMHKADERMTCSVTSARKINDAACGCALQKIPLWDSNHRYYWGGGEGRCNQTGFSSQSGSQGERRDEFHCRERELTLLLKGDQYLS